MLFVSLVPMDRFYKTNTETDLTTLHYMAFIEPLTIFPMEAMSFDSKQFMNNSINKVIEVERTDHFLLIEEHFITAVFCIEKSMKLNLNPCRTEFKSSSQNHEISEKRIMQNKVYHIKFILVILVVQIHILQLT
jgi:hypothetical protein